MDNSTTEMLNYETGEASFIPTLRWLLESTEAETDEHNRPSNLPAGSSVTGSLVKNLASLQLYQKLADKIFSHDNEHDFLWNLIQTGCWNGGDTSMALYDAIKDMLEDIEPFYESLHLNVMEALLMATCRQVTLDRVAEQISRFPDFNPTRDKPFDLEDALLIWVNRCTGLEIDDLLVGCHDGRALNAVLDYYADRDGNRQLRSTASQGRETSLQSVCRFIERYERLCKERCSWKADELLADGNSNIPKRLAIKKLFMQSLCRLFQVLVIDDSTNNIDSAYGSKEEMLNEELDEQPVDSLITLATPTPKEDEEHNLISMPCEESKLDYIAAFKRQQQPEKEDNEQPADDGLLNTVASNQEDFTPDDYNSHLMREQSDEHGSDVINDKNDGDYYYEAISIIERYMELEDEHVESTAGDDIKQKIVQDFLIIDETDCSDNSEEIVAKETNYENNFLVTERDSSGDVCSLIQTDSTVMLPVEKEMSKIVEVEDDQTQSTSYTISFTLNNPLYLVNNSTQSLAEESRQARLHTIASSEPALNRETPKAMWEKRKQRMMERLETRRQHQQSMSQPLLTQVSKSESQLNSSPPPARSAHRSSQQMLSTSNQQLIRNALNRILSGKADAKLLAESARALDADISSKQPMDVEVDQYCILLKSPQHQSYRGLYVLLPTKTADNSGSNTSTLQIRKLHGNGPDWIEQRRVGALYKYDSGSRMFRILSTKAIGPTTHALTLSSVSNQN